MCPDPLQQKHSEILRLEDEVYRITRNNAVPTPHTPLATRAALNDAGGVRREVQHPWALW